MNKSMISGFADEICDDFEEQLKTLNELGIGYICIRAIDGKNITSFNEDDAREYILPKLRAHNIKVSSLGSPIGKVDIDDEDAYNTQLRQLEMLCKISNILGCKYIRLFSFWMPKNEDPERYHDEVIIKMRRFIEICDKYNVTALHENEKGIYGDIGSRCQKIHEAFADTSLRAAYDFANFVQCGENTIVCYNQLKQYIEYIHIKDADMASKIVVLVGTGDGNVREVMKMFSEYDGFLTMEPHLKIFSSLKDLENDTETIDHLKEKCLFPDGKTAFTAQYNALCEILDSIL